jgi:hypothetical protein
MRIFCLLFGEKPGCGVHSGFPYYTQCSVLATSGFYEKRGKNLKPSGKKG